MALTIDREIGDRVIVALARERVGDGIFYECTTLDNYGVNEPFGDGSMGSWTW